MRKEILKKTLRVPVSDTTASGSGEKITRQLDIALMKVGFKLAKDLLEYLNGLHPTTVKELGAEIISVVRELVGDHVKHNVYFKNFPENVPDTVEFWAECIVNALFNPKSAAVVSLQLAHGVVNLLDLPKYGKYWHSYEEMVAAHDEFIPSAKDRVTFVHLGKSLPEEALSVYHSLAGSVIPLNEADQKLLKELAECCIDDPQPEKIPVRENKAIVNQVRLDNGHNLLVDTVTDILRLACSLSDGDVTLAKKTKFKSFPRKVRKALVWELNNVIEASPAKLADVNKYREEWKRLGERLHPGEFKEFTNAHDVFSVARGDKKARSMAAKVEVAFGSGDITKVLTLLENAPGMLFRTLDRILCAASADEVKTLVSTIEKVISRVSGRVILSVREHLQNRTSTHSKRIFANSLGKAWVKDETRESLDQVLVDTLCEVFDKELTRRVRKFENLLLDDQIKKMAIPLSDKNKANGFNILPRGSVMSVPDGIIRLFMYWKQKSQTTDYDLSALMLDEKFSEVKHISYTNLRGRGARHSGDITEAPNGASEFIDVDLNKVGCKYIIPSVFVYSGEGFDEVEESFFGFMERTPEQQGKPFEAKTVRMKSDIRGEGKVVIPLVFIRNDDGTWSAKWLHLFLKGRLSFNRIEENKAITANFARSVIERDYLEMEYLITLLGENADAVSTYDEDQELEGPVTFIGTFAPEGLPEGSQVFTLSNIQDLIPA